MTDRGDGPDMEEPWTDFIASYIQACLTEIGRLTSRPTMLRYLARPCARCGRSFTPNGTRGPLPLYCSQSCRQRAYERRWGKSTAEQRAEQLAATRSAEGDDDGP